MQNLIVASFSLRLLALLVVPISATSPIQHSICQVIPLISDSLVNEIVCENFATWGQLNAANPSALVRTAASNGLVVVGAPINIKPIEPICLTNEFTLPVDIPTLNSEFQLNMIGVSGIDFFAWNISTTNLILIFVESKIEFYYNGMIMTSSNQSDWCNANFLFYINGEGKTSSLLTALHSLYFAWENVYPSEPVCPYMFANTQSMSITMRELVDSILIKNVWQFAQFKNDSSSIPKTINSNVMYLILQGYGYRLDESLLHPLAFERMQIINIFRSIGGIQTDLFKHFQRMIAIVFQLDSLANFFHIIGIEWTLWLRENSLIYFETFKLEAHYSLEGRNYTYPDADFCIFAQWPHQKVILPAFESEDDGTRECTSTLRWLLYNYFALQNLSVVADLITEMPLYTLCKNSIRWNNETLANITNYFKYKIALCNLTAYQPPTSIYPEYYLVKFVSEYFKDLIEFIAIPFASALGLFFNLLIIWIINKNRDKELKDKFYKYMQLNASYGCLYCLLFLFYPINNCVNTLSNGYFCSSIRLSYVTQLYKIVFLAYFGESIKMCANISSILIAINRYMLIGRDGHMPLLKSISEWKMKKVIGISIVLSLLFNIGHIWQYDLNYGNLLTMRTDHQTLSLSFNNVLLYPYDTYPLIPTFIGYFPVSVYLFVYFLINFVLFWLINTSVEIIIVRKLHTELEEKKKRSETMNMTNIATSSTSASPAASSHSFRRERKKAIDDRAEQRSIIMVVTNSVQNFFLRLPELFYIFSNSFQIFGETSSFFIFFDPIYNFNILLGDLTYLCFILTFTTNFFIYFLFNQKFKKTFAMWRVSKRGGNAIKKE